MVSDGESKLSKIVDKILDFPYRKLFGLRGQLAIFSAILIILIIKFIAGINTVALEPKSCKLSVVDSAYLIFHKENILKNSSTLFRTSLMENQRILRHIDDGINPFKSSTDGNVKRARKINRNKFLWRNMVKRLRKENLSIIRCLGKLRTYKF
ncbi:MAG: hypothetical protein CMM58_10975 [Rhodospirillaceae bacterium]|nr:hypothetical protein [Rhodospirillaceae bacterium]|tara:strand:- start:1389 stop:1847 length:459 start_codon:yes stop_codon:yes gene_type:complete